MILKLSECSAVWTSPWLTEVIKTAAPGIQAPPKGTFRVQRMDTLAGLDYDVIAASLKAAYLEQMRAYGDIPDKNKRTESDGVMAVDVHRAFAGLTSREACDPGLWAWFTVFAVPGYVHWRWPTGSLPALAGRMAGNIRRNALARLWWWAEVTHDPEKEIDDQDRYKTTLVTEGRSDFILYVGDCAFSGNRDLLHHLSNLQQTEAKGSKEQQRLCRAVNRIARVICLDSLDVDLQMRMLCERAYQISQNLS